MELINQVRQALADTLQLGPAADKLTASSGLLGTIPEFDSMAVVTLVGEIEDRFGIHIDDDELSADIFETLGSLTEFLASKVNGADIKR